MVADQIIYVRPIRIVASGQVEDLGEVTQEEMTRVNERAQTVGYTRESSLVLAPPNTDRIRLHDPNGEGYHRDYLAQIVRQEQRNKLSLVDENGIPKGERTREDPDGTLEVRDGGRHLFWLVTYEGATRRWLEVISDGHSTWELA